MKVTTGGETNLVKRSRNGAGERRKLSTAAYIRRPSSLKWVERNWEDREEKKKLGQRGDPLYERKSSEVEKGGKGSRKRGRENFTEN